MVESLTRREELMVLYIRTLLRKMGYEKHVIDTEISCLLQPFPETKDDPTKNQTISG